MISKDKIVFGEPLYYMPSYGGVVRVSILKLLGDKTVSVKQYSKKGKDFKPFPVPLVHIYNSNKDAAIGTRAWESYKRKGKGNQK